MRSNYRDLIKLYADREYTGNVISLNNVSHSRIRGLEVMGQTIEVGEGEKSPENPFELVGCTNPILKICGDNLANPNNAYFNSNINPSSAAIVGTRISGTANSYGTYMLGIQIKVESNKTYYLNNIDYGNTSGIKISPVIYQLSNKCNNHNYRELNAATIINTMYSNANAPIKFTTAPNCKYVVVGVKSDTIKEGDEVWIDEIDVGLSARAGYIPYEEQVANIPYTLHSVGDVADSFNPLTGEYTQRTGLKLLSKGDTWRASAVDDVNAVFSYTFGAAGLSYKDSLVCNMLTYKGVAGGYAAALRQGVGLYKYKQNGIVYWYFVVPLTTASTLSEWLSYLETNKVQVAYVLDNPVVTTLTPTYLHANIPSTNIWLDEPNDLGNIQITLQTKE